MISSAILFILGIASFYLHSFFPFLINFLIFSVFSILLIRCSNRKRALFFVIFFLAGLLYPFIRQGASPGIILPQGEVYLQGTIDDVPEASERSIRLTLKDITADGRRFEGRIRVYLIPKTGHIDHSPLMPGNTVSTYTRLKEPDTFRNPGVYSYNPEKEGIIAICFTKELQLQEKGSELSSWSGRKRQRLAGIMDGSLSPDAAAFIKAIIIGLKRGISNNTRDSFSSTGLAHLLSISGTHFGLLAFMLFQSVKRAAKLLPDRVFRKMTLYITPTQAAVITSLPMLMIYVLLSGASTPTIRSFIMVLIYMIALLLGRRGQWLNSLAIAAFIILLWQPDALFDISFQLSFMAVLSIGYVLQRREEDSAGERKKNRLFKMMVQKLWTSILITIAALLGTAPFILLYFKQFPLISPLANLIITPLVCFIILPAGFLSGFVSLFPGIETLPMSGFIERAVEAVLILAGLISRIPYSNIHLPNPPYILIMLYYFSWFFLLKSRVRWRYLPIGIVLLIYLYTPYYFDNDLRITFLDVGQGESAVVELPDGKVMLIDGGPESIDAGRRVIAPYLWSRGINKIDYIVVSHPHPDHYGGLPYIARNFNPEEIWTNGDISDGEMELIDTAVAEGISLKMLKRGELLKKEGYTVLALHPYDEFYSDSPRGEFSDENSLSLVLKIESGGLSALFTGDIEMEAEDDLAHLGSWLKSDIIKVPHHGSRTSSSRSFLKAVRPELAVASVGRNNPYRHPHKSVVQRYIDNGSLLFRTDRDGAVTVTLKDGNYNVSTYSDSSFKNADDWQDELKNLRLLF